MKFNLPLGVAVSAICFILGGVGQWFAVTSTINGEIQSNKTSLESKATKEEVMSIDTRLIDVERYKESSEPTRVNAIKQLGETNVRLNSMENQIKGNARRLERIESLLMKIANE